MLKTITDIFDATGQALMQPIQFGRFSGRHLFDLSEREIMLLAEATQTSPAVLDEKWKAARELKARPGKRRPFDTKNNIEGLSLLHWQERYSNEYADADFFGCFAKPGTGKTKFIINYMRARWYPHDRALIICPKNVFSTWEKELKECLPKAVSLVARGSYSNKIQALQRKSDFLIVNYDSFANKHFVRMCQEQGFSWCILDESHKIKNPFAKRTAAILDLSASIQMRICMTGTPTGKDEEDFFPQISFLDRGATLGGSIYSFRKHWEKSINVEKFNQQTKKKEIVAKKYEFKEELKQKFYEKIGRISFVVQKKEVMDLPDKVFQSIEIDLTGETLRVYKEIEKEALAIFEDQEIVATVKIAEIIKLRQIAGGTVKSLDGVELQIGKDKISALLDFVENSQDQAVIVCNFTAQLEALKAAFTRAGHSIAVGAAGRYKEADLIEARNQFYCGKTQFLLLNQQAGAEGIDGLQCCNQMLFYSCDYSLLKREQIEDRLHRKGQVNKCLYVDFLATIAGKPTIDHVILQAIQDKTDNVNEIMRRIVQGARGWKYENDGSNQVWDK